MNLTELLALIEAGQVTVGHIVELAERLKALWGTQMVLTPEMLDAGLAAMPTPLKPIPEEPQG